MLAMMAFFCELVNAGDFAAGVESPVQFNWQLGRRQLDNEVSWKSIQHLWISLSLLLGCKSTVAEAPGISSGSSAFVRSFVKPHRLPFNAATTVSTADTPKVSPTSVIGTRNLAQRGRDKEIEKKKQG
jgi:hypothetical protein